MSESDFEANLRQLRREKLAQIVALGQEAYPNSYAFTHTIPELRKLDIPDNTAEALAAQHIEASIAGRLMAIRLQGKAGFAQLQQGGERLQIYIRKDDVGEQLFALYKLLDLGDHIGVRGFLMRTRTGELTLHAHTVNGELALTFLTKAMLALPDKYHGLEDTELRYRQRYVDLFMNTGHTIKADPQAPAVQPSAPITNPTQPPVILSEVKDPASADPTTTAPSPTEAVILSEAKDPEGARPAHTAPALSTPDPDSTEPPTDEPLNVRETFVKRAAILRAIRKFFDERGFLEVETPMLHTIAGGAAARPFTTHHNALDIPLSLRIAPELFLKRLVVGGLDRVYEINRNFRNEGVSTKHNPEFTMLEFYQAYANYEDLMDLTEELVGFVATEINGTTVCKFNENEIDLGKWNRLTMKNAILKFWRPQYGPTPRLDDFASNEALRGVVRTAAVELGKAATDENREIKDQGLLQLYSLFAQIGSKARTSPLGKTIASIFEVVAEPHLIQPTIIYDFPLAVSPLSKQKPDDPEWVERFEFYIGGFEVGNAFSELNDPDEQRKRFQAQVADKDPESMAEVDEDYVRALGYGLPPTAGEGIGIDRLTMILTGAKSIRDVILFPLMRPPKPPS